MPGDLPPSLEVSPNIPFEEQTLDQLRLERDYWAAQLAGATGWGSPVAAIVAYRNACEAWIKRREAENV